MIPRLVLIALIPLVLGIVVVYNRHQLLRIPKVGFILHAMAGGPVPPVRFIVIFRSPTNVKQYLDLKIFDRQDEFLAPNDVVISVPPKSGTTWVRCYWISLYDTNRDCSDDVYLAHIAREG